MPAKREIQFVPQRRDAIRVRIVASGACSKAGIEDGDVTLGVEGEDLPAGSEAMSILGARIEFETIVLRVRRASGRVRLRGGALA